MKTTTKATLVLLALGASALIIGAQENRGGPPMRRHRRRHCRSSPRWIQTTTA